VQRIEAQALNPTWDLDIAFDVTRYKVPSIEWPETSLAIDLGGAGDCFLRGLNFLSALQQLPLFKMKRLYEALGLNYLEFLEDTHLNMLSGALSVQFLVIRLDGEKGKIALIGKEGPVLKFLNLGVQHFMPIVDGTINDISSALVAKRIPSLSVDTTESLNFSISDFDFKEEVKESDEVKEEVLPAEESDPEMESASSKSEYSIESDEVDLEEHGVVQGVCFPSTSDPASFIAWLLSLNAVTFNNIVEVLAIFSFFCKEIPIVVKKLEECGKTMNSDVVKECYKLRHNVFASVCKSFLGYFDGHLDTDVPLASLGINTNKTPDLIIEIDGVNVIFEFTVSSKWQNVLYNKGGGLLDIKYSNEVDELNSKGIKSSLCILAAVMEDQNIESIVKDLSKYSKSNAMQLRADLRNFFSNSLSSQATLAKLNQSSLIADYEVPEQFEQAFDRITGALLQDKESLFDVVTEKITVCINTDIVASILGRSQRSAETLKRISLYKKDTAKIKLSFDIANPGQGIRWNFGNFGTDVVDAVKALESADISKILPLVGFHRSGSHVSYSEISGSVPVTIPRQQKNTHLSPFDFNLPFDFDYVSSTVDLDQVTCPISETIFKTSVPPDYYSKLLNIDIGKIIKQDKAGSSKMLVNNEINLSTVKEVISELDQIQSVAMVPKNLEHHPRPLAMYPISSGLITSDNLETMSTELISAIIKKPGDPYTSMLLSMVLEDKFVTSLVHEDDEAAFELKQEMSRLNTSLFKLLSDARSDTKETIAETKRKFSKKIIPDVDGQFESLSNSLSEANKKYRLNIKKSSSGKALTRLLQLKCKPKSAVDSAFKEEMQHFHKNGARFLAVDSSKIDQVKVISNVEKLMNSLVSPSLKPIKFKLYNGPNGQDSEFLSGIKTSLHSGWDKLLDQYSKTPLFQSLLLTQSLCKTLFKESCRSYNRHFVKVDNLGFENVLCLVRGGKKIFTKQVSRLFRLAYPIDDVCFEACGYSENQNFQEIFVSGVRYLLTPWMQLHQDVLYDGMTFIYRSFSYIHSVVQNNGTMSVESMDLKDTLPLVLGLSNRRKTESFMHNVRYLIVNPLGDFSNLKDMINGFSGVNYTYLDLYLRKRLIENYVLYYIKALKFKTSKTGFLDDTLAESPLMCIFTGCEINTSFSLVNSIYCTYLMTKAPVNPKLEQAANLLPILKDVSTYQRDHKDVKMMCDVSQHMSVIESGSEVYDDDFKYDPIFSQYLGTYLGSFLANAAGKLKISNIWNSCLSAPLDRMANSNGLRGWKKENFFNKKGYEVVYEYIQDKTDTDLNKMVQDYYSMDDKRAISEMSQDKYTFWKHYRSLEQRKEKILDRATFHIVDKIQRGGGREIFVMDIMTKSVQFPVERFFSRLCKLVPNEMISVPSNKRSNVVHSMFFERKQGSWIKQILKWVLDCRRWAPHSVFQKYVHFVHGMSHVLPKSFLCQFYFLAEKMMEKRYVVRPSVHQVIKGNISYSEYMDSLKPCNSPVDFFELDVPFSFVMGIFNYLSSLMHAANQLCASELIRDWHLKRNLGMVAMSMNAHSDDSAGESQHENLESIPTTLGLYDWLLKAGNHMLSVKKSQVNTNVYFEFLSILYLKRQMLPVSPKFLSSMPFKPTDNGYSSDVMFAVSQSIEAFSQGCSQSESYLLMKLSEKFIQGIYNLTQPTGLSPQLLGGVDSFPIEYMLGGPLTDLWKDTMYNSKIFKKAIYVLKKSGLMDREEKIPSVRWDMKSRLPTKHVFKANIEDIPDKLLNSWFLENCKSESPLLNIVWYVKKLQDRKYLASLVNEPDSRRYSRIFGSVKNRSLIRQDGTRLPVGEVHSLLMVLKDVEDVDIDINDINKVISLLVGELANFHDAISHNDFDETRFTSFKRTVKPIRLTASFSHLGTIGDITANEYIVHKFEPEMFKFFGKTKDISKSVAYLDNILTAYLPGGNCSPDLIKPLLNRVTGRDNKIYNFINTVDSDIRNLMDHEGYLKLFCESIKPNFRLMTDYKRAVALDSNISYSRRGIPQQVRDLICIENSSRFFKHWAVDKKDIFVTNMEQEHESLKSSVPLDWLPYVYQEYTNDTLLSENNFWSIWKKEQKKWSREWIGEGELIFGLPECNFKVYMMNDVIKLIESDTSELFEFGQMSSWFLGGIFEKELRVKSQMKSPDVVPDDQVVLGYSHSKKSWGIGFSYTFDLVFDVYSGLGHSFDNLLNMNVQWKLDQSGRQIALMETGQTYKVKKILDTEFDKFTDIGKFLDPKKMASLKDKTVEKMCRECALIQGKNVRYNLNTLIDNISRTKVYNLCFRFSKADKVNNEIISDALLDAMIEERERDNNFGFPNKEEIIALSSNPWKATMPSSVQQYAYKLGSVALTDDELEYAYNIISSNENTDVELVLADLRMLYGEVSAVQNLVSYLVKDTRIFNMTFMLGPGTRIASIHEDMYRLAVYFLDSRKVSSNYLSLRKREISRMFKKDVPESEIFGILHVKALLDCMVTHSSQHFGSKACDTVIGILKEVFEGLNPIEISRFHFQTDILRTTDFFKDPILRNKWLCDIFDSVCQTGWFPRGKVPTQKAINGIMTHFGQLAAFAAKINYLGDSSLHVKLKNKTRFTIRRFEDKPTPGLVSEDFYPLSEDDLDEYEFSIGVEEEPEGEVSGAEKGKAPTMRFLQKNLTTLDSLRWVRGTAWELFIMSNTITTEMIRLCRVFEKTNFKGYRDYVAHQDTYILYVGSRKGAIDISGYTEVQFEFKGRLLNYEKNVSKTFSDIDGNEHDKEEVFKSPFKMGNIYSKVNALWGRVSVSDDLHEKIRSIHSHAVQYYDERNPLLETLEKYQKLIDSAKEGDTAKETQKVVVPAAKLEDILADIVKSVMDEGFLESAKKVEFSNPDIQRMETLMRYKPENYIVGKRVNILTDERVRAELETISPGICAKLFSRDTLLTARSKNTLLKMSRKSTTSERNKDLKKKKARMHLVISTLLGSIVETNLQNREDSGLFRDITNLVVEMDEESEDEQFPSLFEIEPSIDDIDINIDYEDFLWKTFR
jgi:hypothetical protein